MPLVNGKSEKAFKKNVEIEMEHGKPQKQALAIAYNMKRKKKPKHYDDGGDVGDVNASTPTFGSDPAAAALAQSGKGGGGGGGGGGMSSMMQMAPMLLAAAEGGDIPDKKQRARNAFHGHQKGVHADLSTYGAGDRGMSGAGKMVREKGEDDIGFAKDLHRRKLQEMKSMKKPDLMAHGGEPMPMPNTDTDDMRSPAERAHEGYADGGPVHNDPNKGWSQKDKEDFARGAGGSPEPQHPDPFKSADNGGSFFGMAHGGRVDRIMKKRMMSEGGMAANDVGEGQEADHDPNQFDDLVLDDHLEEHETGENSGDHLGNEQLEHDEHDIVSRIMKSRAKKDRNPRPA